MAKTIKQIADELGIDKQRVYRYIKKNHINEAHQNGSVMYYDEAAEMLIKQGLSGESASSEAHQSASNDAVIDVLLMQCDMLKKELEIKNKQIEDLSAALVAAQQSAQTAQALHAGTMRKQIEDAEAKKKRFFLTRMFSRGED